MFRRRARGAREERRPLTRDTCMAAACGVSDAVRCGYRDRRGRHCATFWCSQHGSTALGRAYCRRHATTIDALSGADVSEGMPDLENRAPSLVGWVSRELDQAVRLALLRHSTPGSRLVVDPVRLTVRSGMDRRWHRRWKLVDHTGILRGVAVEVDEGDDSRVVTRVDSQVIGRSLPPWIEQRRRGHALTPEADADNRRWFSDTLMRSIELVVDREEVAPRYRR
jgi:hypothetical protein